MISELDLILWLRAHPFVLLEIVSTLGAMSLAGTKDWNKFKDAKIGDSTLTFNWRRAGLEYGKAALTGAVPPFVAKVWQILGAALGTPIL